MRQFTLLQILKSNILVFGMWVSEGKKYFIAYSDLNFRHAGSKAKKDIVRILELIGYSPIILPRTRKWKHKIIGCLGVCLIGIRRFFKLFFLLPSNSYLVINHPFDFVSMNYALPRIARKNKVILINHDVEFCRYENDEDWQKREGSEKYRKLYNAVSGAIIPSPTIDVLQKAGVSNPVITPLSIFPYLLDISKLQDRGFSLSVAFTGNFEKAEFVNSWLGMNRSHSIELIGIKADKLELKGDAIYKGSFDADVVPFKVESSFGLVWDGDSVDSCTGNYGNYLRYNSPHKLSLYLAIGIPVFIWREAGMAGFVEKNKVGFLIDSLSDIDKILADMTEEKYKEMQENIKPIQKKITDGSYLVEALDDVLSRI